MFRIIDFRSLIRYVAIFTTVASICIYELIQNIWDEKIPIIRIISIAPWVSLIVLVILSTGFTSRPIWKLVRRFDKSLFPDLNGTWEGEITTEADKTIKITARIRHSLLQTWIDIHTETSKSQTLEATPATEGGQCKLYYLFRSIPKNSDWPMYTGMTVFDVRMVTVDGESILELSGNYFTDRKSKGRTRLRHIGNDGDDDVSFY